MTHRRLGVPPSILIADLQRHAWYPYFDDINAIIFLAPISCFDETLAEDKRVNRLQDSLLLWKAVCSTKILARVQFILVSLGALVVYGNRIDLLIRAVFEQVRSFAEEACARRPRRRPYPYLPRAAQRRTVGGEMCVIYGIVFIRPCNDIVARCCRFPRSVQGRSHQVFARAAGILLLSHVRRGTSTTILNLVLLRAFVVICECFLVACPTSRLAVHTSDCFTGRAGLLVLNSFVPCDRSRFPNFWRCVDITLYHRTRKPPLSKSLRVRSCLFERIWRCTNMASSPRRNPAQSPQGRRYPLISRPPDSQQRP